MFIKNRYFIARKLSSFFPYAKQENCNLITYLLFFFFFMGEFIKKEKSLFWSKNHFSLEKASQ